MDKGKGKGKSKPTLGDSAKDFKTQWDASRSAKQPTVIEHDGDVTQADRNRSIEQTLRSWKRGGGEVKVTKGNSTVFENGRNRSNRPPPCKKPTPRVVVPPPASRPIPRPAPTLASKSLRQRLSEASADLRSLQITAAMSRPRSFVELPPVVESTDGKLAILGLDFGTAFTKAVVRWAGRHYAVDWSDAIEGEDHHLLASVFSEAPDGHCVLGAHVRSGWTVREGIKLQLLTSPATGVDENLAYAVMFIALAFRYVDRWLRRTSKEAEKGIRWRLHVGLPTKSWDNDGTTETFKTVAQAARVLACMSGPVTRAAAMEALRRTDQVDRPAVDVFPEFACQLYSYLQSPERRDDLHALIDVGAGTIDVAYFNIFIKDGESLLPIFASVVERLGAHYLIAALSGVAGHPEWTDGDSSLTDEEVALKLDDSPNDVCNRRSLYLSSVAEAFNIVTSEAMKIYPTSPAVQGRENVRLFLCGGGSRIPTLQKRFERISKEAPRVFGIKFQVSELVRPRDIVTKLDSGFDRLSVAYGLSQNAANIGLVMRSATLDPLSPIGRGEWVDRDADR